MAISFVGWTQGATPTIPAHVSGDLIVVEAFDDTSTPPSLASGYTNINTRSNTTAANAVRVGYKIAASSSETLGTWTNAYWHFVTVYRGAGGIGATSAASTTSFVNTITYASITLTDTSGSSWLAAIGYHSSAGNLNTAPTDFTIRSNRTSLWQHIDRANVSSSPYSSFTKSTNTFGYPYSVMYEILEADGSVSVTPGITALTTSGYAPTAHVSDNKRAFPDAAALTTTGYAPLAQLGTVSRPTPANLTVTAHQPTARYSVAPRNYYIDSEGNVYWVVNQEIGLVEPV